MAVGVTCVLLHNTENGARALQEPWLQEDWEVSPGSSRPHCFAALCLNIIVFEKEKSKPMT